MQNWIGYASKCQNRVWVTYRVSVEEIWQDSHYTDKKNKLWGWVSRQEVDALIGDDAGSADTKERRNSKMRKIKKQQRQWEKTVTYARKQWDIEIRSKLDDHALHDTEPDPYDTAKKDREDMPAKPQECSQQDLRNYLRGTRLKARDD